MSTSTMQKAAAVLLILTAVWPIIGYAFFWNSWEITGERWYSQGLVFTSPEDASRHIKATFFVNFLAWIAGGILFKIARNNLVRTGLVMIYVGYLIAFMGIYPKTPTAIVFGLTLIKLLFVSYGFYFLYTSRDWVHELLSRRYSHTWLFVPLVVGVVSCIPSGILLNLGSGLDLSETNMNYFYRFFLIVLAVFESVAYWKICRSRLFEGWRPFLSKNDFTWLSIGYGSYLTEKTDWPSMINKFTVGGVVVYTLGCFFQYIWGAYMAEDIIKLTVE